MKRILIITATLALCAVITVVPCFAITTGFYDGETIIRVLGAKYQLTLQGANDDGIALFDTRDLYWYEEGDLDAFFDSGVTSYSYPDCYYRQDVLVDADASIVYNDLQFYIDAPTDFPLYDTSVLTYMKSDYFKTYSGARLGLHLNPIINSVDGSHIVTNGETTSATLTFYALDTDGHVIEAFKYRDDLLVGGTYDLTASLSEFFEGRDVQYYWIEYDGVNVVPTFVQDFDYLGGEPFTQVKVVDFATDIVYPEYVDYSDFNLLQWISTAVDGFMRAPLFILGDFTVTLGAVLAVSIAVPIFVAFLRRYAGG